MTSSMTHFWFSVCDDQGALQARGGVASRYEIGKNKTACVTILDDDHRGCFSFTEGEMTIQENIGHLDVQVIFFFWRKKSKMGFIRLQMLIQLIGCRV